MSQAVEIFGVRVGTNRAKLATFLLNNKGKERSVADAIRSVYGNRDAEKKPALMRVVFGLDNIIKDAKLPYEIVSVDGKIYMAEKAKKAKK